jgi:uncharacterized protein (TIGR02444 family)
MASGGHGEGEAFWRFSLAFYARPGAAPALIALQDRDGLDVNVILYALWLGLARGHAMNMADLAAAESAAAPLRDAVVVELRGLRRRLRAHPDPDIQALRRRVQALEIAAERAVQERLAASVTRHASVPAARPLPLPAAAGRGRDPRAAWEGEGPAQTADDRLKIASANLGLCLGAAAGSAEAETIRAALVGFSRRA